MRLIDADKIDFSYCDDEFDCIFVVDKALTIDAAPVVHGHWEHDETGANFCSVCYEYPYDDGEYHLLWHTDYCPHCGAKMEEVC